MARNLSSLTISAPTSDPNQSEGGSFTFTVTPGFVGGGGVTAYDLDLQWDQGTATWQTIPASGGLSTSGTAYYASTTQDTAFTITVDCNTAGSYNIRAINVGRSITSTPTSQAVTVTGAAVDVDAEPTGAEISGDAGTSESTIGIDVDAPTASITGEAQAPADVTGDASVDLTGATIAGEAGTAAAVVPRPTVGPFAFGSHGLAVNSYGSFSKSGAVSDQGEPTGAAIAGQAGAPANVTGDANYTLTGAAAAGEAGAPSSVTTGVSYTATGAEAPGEAGTVTPNTDVNYTVTGAAIAGEAGTSTVQIDISVDLTGAQIAGEAGTSASEVSIDADLTGAASAGEAQTVTVTGDANYTLTGAAIAGEAGTSDAVTPDAVAEPTGAESAAEAGTVTAQGNANHTLTGAEIGADAGTVTITGDVNVTLTGAESSADAGAVVGDGGAADKGTFDTPNVSPLGLAIRQYGAFDHTGLLRDGLGDLTPLGLHQRAYGSFEAKLQVAVITGAQSNAEAGTVNVVATIGRKSQLSPHGLVTYPRNFSKQVNQNVSVNITGAAIELQWSTPDLADASVYTDGSDIDGESGSVASSVAFVTTAAIAGEAGTVSVSVDIDAAVTGAEINGETGGVTAIGGTGGTDVAVTPNPPVEIAGEAGTVTAAYDWAQTITGAQINAEAAEVGLDIKRDVSATVTGAQIDAEAADPALAGPHVSVNIDSGTIVGEAGEPKQVKRKGGRVRRRRRYVVEIDGQLIQAASPQEVQYLLEQARELAAESAERDVVTSEVTDTPTIKVRTASGKESTSEPIRYAVQQTRKAIRKIYIDVAKRRAIDEEISKLLIAKIELEDQDEEDAILALLLS